MTTATLRDMILTADLDSADDRLILADACDDAGRHLDAALLRAVHLPVCLLGDGDAVYPDLLADVVTYQDGEPSWVNCAWAGSPRGLGGVWIAAEDGTWEDGTSRRRGDIRPYRGSEQTGGVGHPYSPDFWRGLLRADGLELDETDARDLSDRVEDASVAACCDAVAAEFERLDRRAATYAVLRSQGGSWVWAGDHSEEAPTSADLPENVLTMLEEGEEGEVLGDDGRTYRVERRADGRRS
jgi:hypothetical protein